MNELKNILVPTDFAQGGKHALTYAVDLARHTGARLHVFHVKKMVVAFLFPSSLIQACLRLK